MASERRALPAGLAVRLRALRSLYVAERDDEARRRLARERPRRVASFDVEVAGRLRELRALSDLADHLHRARIAHKPPTPRA
jgi:hypothetical protein